MHGLCAVWGQFVFFTGFNEPPPERQTVVGVDVDFIGKLTRKGNAKYPGRDVSYHSLTPIHKGEVCWIEV